MRIGQHFISHRKPYFRQLVDKFLKAFNHRKGKKRETVRNLSNRSPSAKQWSSKGVINHQKDRRLHQGVRKYVRISLLNWWRLMWVETLLLPPSIQRTTDNPQWVSRLILTWMLGKGSQKDKIETSPSNLSINHAVEIHHNQCKFFSTLHLRL